MGTLKRMFSSRKNIVAVVGIAVNAALLFGVTIPDDKAQQLVDMVTWISMTLIGATAAEDAAQKFGLPPTNPTK